MAWMVDYDGRTMVQLIEYYSGVSYSMVYSGVEPTVLNRRGVLH